jgi:hypothetical protein
MVGFKDGTVSSRMTRAMSMTSHPWDMTPNLDVASRNVPVVAPNVGQTDHPVLQSEEGYPCSVHQMALDINTMRLMVSVWVVTLTKALVKLTENTEDMETP